MHVDKIPYLRRWENGDKRIVAVDVRGAIGVAAAQTRAAGDIIMPLLGVSGRVDEQLRLKAEYRAPENRILRDQIKRRSRLADGQRITLAELGKKLGRETLDSVACIVTPETILRWHREVVARKFDGSGYRKTSPVGRPPVDPAIVEQTIKNILEEHGIDPAPTRKSKTSWSDFIKSHADSLLTTDFLTTEVQTAFGLVTHHILFLHPHRQPQGLLRRTHAQSHR